MPGCFGLVGGFGGGVEGGGCPLVPVLAGALLGVHPAAFLGFGAADGAGGGIGWLAMGERAISAPGGWTGRGIEPVPGLLDGAGGDA